MLNLFIFILFVSIGLYGFYSVYNSHKPEVKEWIWVGQGKDPFKK